jgi:hypothetical protein
MRAARDLCKACLHPIQQAVGTYRLTTDLALRLLAVDHCDLCGDVLELFEARVDHDHACCPGRQSCGECVRGFVHHSCNIGIGAWENMRERWRMTGYRLPPDSPYRAVLAFPDDRPATQDLDPTPLPG